MPSATIPVVQYNGSLVGAQLLTPSTTLVLSSIGPSSSGTVVDNDGTLSVSDDGISTFNGNPITYIGSGTAQAGVKVGLATVPLGATHDVVIFSAGGHIYFSYPGGAPSVVGQVAIILNVTATPGHLFTPVCFAAGTMIATPTGETKVEDLVAGDKIIDVDGVVHEITWVGGRKVDLPERNVAWAEAWRPVIIPAHALGRGRPSRDLVVSQQHRLLMEGAWPELMFGEDRVLVPAKALVGEIIHIDRKCAQIAYHHILCAEHIVLVANGMPAESLSPSALRDTVDGSVSEAAMMFPELGCLTVQDNAPMAYTVQRSHLASALPVPARRNA